MKNFLLQLFLLTCSLLTFYVKADHNSQKHVIGVHPAGLFSSFLAVLNQLSWCEKNNKIPVVYWDKNSLYYKEGGFNGSSNVWEYYFDPVSYLAYAPGDIVNTGYWWTENDLSYGSINKSQRDYAYKLITKYIKIKTPIQKKIDAFYEKNMLNKKTIGIHLRRTDKYIEEKLISVQQIIESTLKNSDTDAQFLIATDEQVSLNSMINLLKDRTVIYYDCYRSTNGKPLHKSPPKAQLGEDALIEVLLLAKCNKLIHTISNLSTAVLYFNPHITNILLQ
jgi:hypothetical protein